MSFLIRTIDFTATGREIVRDRTLEQQTLTVGRASENDIHLPDLAVEQRHISITDQGDGSLQVEALGTLGFTIDGRSTTSTQVDAGAGCEIELGSARLAIAREGGQAGAITITIRQAEEKGRRTEAVSGFALGSALPSKRTMAWAFSLVILALLLCVPIITHLMRAPVETDQDMVRRGTMIDQVAFDSTWSSGELSLAHHDLKDNCEACHATPFVSVQDKTCLTCHEELGEHAEPQRLRAGMAPLPASEAWQWAVAETLGKEGPGSCTSCHIEHEGPVRQQAATEQFCADCHAGLDQRLTKVSFDNADDFGKQHPQFRPTFYTAYGKDIEPSRVSLSGNPVEKSGLKFPHDIHMDENGGVARMAISLPDYDGPLECASCHELTADEVGFKPVEMEPACESCHSLVFDEVGGEFRSLRHGKVVELREDLMRMSRAPRRPVATQRLPGRERPGQFALGGTYAVNFGRPASSLISINRALLPDGVCGDCHIPTRTAGQPDVTPVNLPDRYMMHGFFSHAAHEEEECTDCHEATQSKEATDLLLPDLESCRDCHEGASAVKTAEIVPSGCAMCHGYHTPTNPWPADHPILQDRPAAPMDNAIASLSAWLKD